MIDQTSLEGRIITAAFRLAETRGFEAIALRDIADEAGVTLAEAMERFDDKGDVLKVFGAHVDRAMLAGAHTIERAQGARDAVFEVIMSRFDAMAPYKAGLKAIVDARPQALVPDFDVVRMSLKTQNKIMQAAGISAEGGAALMRQIGLAQIYEQVFRIWLDDTDAGMARTMAALDRRLRQGERTLRTIDDVAMSAVRMCERASTLTAQMVERMRGAGARRTADGGDEAPAAPPETPQAHGSDGGSNGGGNGERPAAGGSTAG